MRPYILFFNFHLSIFNSQLSIHICPYFSDVLSKFAAEFQNHIVMSKNLVNKYVWLVDTIHNAGRISLNELNEKWRDANLDGSIEIPERRFHKWRNAVEDLFGVIIDCERKGGYHYYIVNAEELKGGGMRNWLLDTLSVSNLMLGHKKLHNRILTEDIPSGREHLPDILEAMSEDAVISITYQSYWHDTPSTFEVEPYCVKMFKQRWYLLAHSIADDTMRIYALDRIHDTDITERTFQLPDDFDPAGYFEECYGIIANTGAKKETVRLKVSAQQSNYMRSLPLHHSQTEVERTDKHSIFELKLRPAYDFEMELLSMGSELEVLSPEWLREKMRNSAKEMYQKYKRKV